MYAIRSYYANFDSDDSSFNFDTIADGDVVEVSGDYGPDSRLYATYIEEQGADDNEYEAKGTVSNWDRSATFVLNMRGGATLNVRLDPNGAEIPDVGIEDTQFVEVEGVIEDPAAVDRITSYNVCYTKLLRRNRPAFRTSRWP